MTRHPVSLRQRMVLTGIVWVCGGLAICALMIRIAFMDSIERSMQQRLNAALLSVVAAVEWDVPNRPILRRSLDDVRFDQPLSGWYWQIADANGPVLRSRSLWDYALPIQPPPESPALAVFGRNVGPKGEILFTAERDIATDHASSDSSQAWLHVVVAMPDAEIAADVKQFDTVLALSFGAVAILLSIGMVLQIAVALRPVTALAAQIHAMERSPTRRLDGPFPRELAPLANGLNCVLDHDRRLVERAKTHVGNLAHGLKTPLAVLRAHTDDCSLPYDLLQEQLDRMQRLIDHHLTQARLQANPASLGRIHTPIAPVVQDICRTLGRIAANRGLTMDNRCSDQAHCAVPADDLAEIVGNLLENACKWAAGTIVVSERGAVGADESPWIQITVEDDGPGIAADRRDWLVQRGHKLDETMAGHGLGLSIVSDIAGFYGGSLLLSTSSLGGLLACVSLPIMTARE